eukprot:1963163-Pyramimonas_sp.AAC.1
MACSIHFAMNTWSFALDAPCTLANSGALEGREDKSIAPLHFAARVETPVGNTGCLETCSPWLMCTDMGASETMQRCSAICSLMYRTSSAETPAFSSSS